MLRILVQRTKNVGERGLVTWRRWVHHDTIFAPCSIRLGLTSSQPMCDHVDQGNWHGLEHQLPSAVCIIRVSGAMSLNVLRGLTMDKSFEPKPNMMYIRSLYHPNTNGDREDAMPLDYNSMVVFFEKPRSFTGEDVVEFHVHGGRSVVHGVLDALFHFPLQRDGKGRVRPANPGEFTRRAFENGKMDLTQIEGLSDVLVSQTTSQKHLGMASLLGMGKDVIQSWRSTLISCLASIEAVIDFGEDDIDPSDVNAVLEDARSRAQELCEEIQKCIIMAPRSEMIKEGIRAVLIGPPNVGKSSVLNALIGRPAAIVSSQAGTTRDIIEVALDVGGQKVVVQDGAGIRDTRGDDIESEGISRIIEAAKHAHILLVLSSVDSDPLSTTGDERIQSIIDSAKHVLYIENKSDLLGSNTTSSREMAPGTLQISCRTGEGIESLISALQHSSAMLLKGTNHDDSPLSPNNIARQLPILHRERHLHHMKIALEALHRFAHESELELAAEELRSAAIELGRVTGNIDIEDVLEKIFKEFCIGK
jgi:tRNA modification GTPase